MQQELIASWVRKDGVPYVTVEGELTAASAFLLDKVLFEARSDEPFLSSFASSGTARSFL